MEHVYFVQCQLPPPAVGPIKIGFSNDVVARIDNLQGASPFPLQLLLVLVGGFELEQSLHAKFAESRTNGEWFQPTTELLEYIRNQPQAHGFQALSCVNCGDQVVYLMVPVAHPCGGGKVGSCQQVRTKGQTTPQTSKSTWTKERRASVDSRQQFEISH